MHESLICPEKFPKPECWFSNRIHNGSTGFRNKFLKIKRENSWWSVNWH